MIVTSNLSDFPADVAAAYAIEIQHPDEFFLNQLDLDPRRVVHALARQAEATKRPPMDV